jgi:hypothetical protein
MKTSQTHPNRTLTRPMNKAKKTFTIIDAIHNKDVFGGLPFWRGIATKPK